MDLGPAFLKSVTAEGHAPQAVVCADPFHCVKLVGDALDEVRRDMWNQLRRLPDAGWAKAYKGARWALLKNPGDLTDTQQAKLAGIKRAGGATWRAYEMKGRHSGRSSPVTSTGPAPLKPSTGGAPGRNAPGSPRSSEPPAPCASGAT